MGGLNPAWSQSGALLAEWTAQAQAPDARITALQTENADLRDMIALLRGRMLEMEAQLAASIGLVDAMRGAAPTSNVRAFPVRALGAHRQPIGLVTT